VGLIEGVDEATATGEVRALFEEMKRVRGWDRVPVMWRIMALRPAYLRATWEKYKAVMLEGSMDLRTKEMLALTVSMVNRCSYCIDSHSLALRKMGMTDAELMEMMGVIDFFSSTNALTSALKLEFDGPPTTAAARS